MAYQFWKSGLLGHDFHYRPFATRMNGDTLWATTSDPSLAVADHPAFGAAAATYNVIDVRQAYLQKLLKQALSAIGHQAEADRLTHFSYEMVALSHATAKELGFAPPPDSEDAKRPFVEVSGRKGLGVKADDLIDRVIAKALVGGRPAPDRPAGRRAAPHRRRHRHRRRALLPDQVLAHQGDRVRHRRGAQLRGRERPVPAVRRGARQQHLPEAARPARHRRGRHAGAPAHDCRPTSSTAATATTNCGRWSSRPSRLDDVVEQVVRTLEFAVLAKYGFGLAQMFNAFYHRAQILNEERDDVRRWRAAAVAYFRLQLTRDARSDGRCCSAANVGRLRIWP